MKPLISICIPTYNGAKYLRECLDSVTAQTFTEFEVLLVDDQSSDETFSIAQEYAQKDYRIRLIRNEQNLGLVGNWNRCVELAQGEWIKFVFQDDLIAPECLEKMLAASKPDSFIICCLRNFIFEAGISDHTQWFFKNILTVEKLFPKSTEVSANDYSKGVLDDIIYYNFVGEPTAVMLRREVFHKFGTFNSHLVQVCDFEYWTRVAVHTGITYVPEILATFRVHSNATSAKNLSGRQYRTLTLDPLILIHDFALHPNYAPLRVIACTQTKPIDLVAMLNKKSYWAWREAIKNPDTLKEWEKITRLYPVLIKFSRRNLILRAIIRMIQLLKSMKYKIRDLIQYKSQLKQKKSVV